MKRTMVAICLVIALVLGLSSVVSAAGPPEKPVTPPEPELKEITFIHHVKPEKGGESQPAPVNDYYKLLGLYLPTTVTYYVNPSGAPGKAVDEIQKAFETWDGVTAQELFNPAGSTSTKVTGLKKDGKNTVSWAGNLATNIIAVTRLWYKNDRDPTTLDPIIEFDIVFNARLPWGIDTDGEGPLTLSNAYDVCDIATHEAGHVVGLDDLYADQYRELTMYGYSSKGETIKISLQQGDIVGAQYLYGAP